MTTGDSLRTDYESTPYHDQSFQEFDLSRLLGFAELFGLRDPGCGPGELRVLDLGCASGAHLRDQAVRHPGARFDGIDFSATEIEIGQKAIVEAGLSNIELVQADLRAIEVDSEAYDLVLCHGVFSWVPDEVKERIFLLARQALKPAGVAAIAYLTYPGWKQLEAFRELLMMRAHSSRPAADRVRESALLLRLLRESYDAAPNDVHAKSLSRMVERMQKSSSNAFLHDELGAVHDPCYFMQFAEWAEECGLRYLAETDLGTMVAEGLDPVTEPILDALAPTFLETQQWVDFAVNRSGRSSLLVRSDQSPGRVFTGERLRALRFGTLWWNVTALNRRSGEPDVFESPQGRRVEIEDPGVKSVLLRLCDDRSEGVSYAELAQSFLGSERPGCAKDEEGGFEKALSSMLARGVIEPRAFA